MTESPGTPIWEDTEVPEDSNAEPEDAGHTVTESESNDSDQ